MAVQVPCSSVRLGLTRLRTIAVGKPSKPSCSRIPCVYDDGTGEPIVPSLPGAIGENPEATEKQRRNAQRKYERSDACCPSTDWRSAGTLDPIPRIAIPIVLPLIAHWYEK